MPLTVHLLLVFHSRLKIFLFLQILPTAAFFFFRTDCIIPQTFTVTSSVICFYFFSFSVLQFLVVVSVRWIKLTHVGFRGHVKIASCIVSYRIETRVKYRGGHCLLCPPVIILGDMSPCPPPPVSAPMCTLHANHQ